ncbi:MAG: hypothetical protein ABSE87_14530 [Terracidiphilus sp.]
MTRSDKAIDPTDHSDQGAIGQSLRVLTSGDYPATPDLIKRVSAMSFEGQRFLSDVLRVYNSACLSEEERGRVNDSTGLAALFGDFIKRNRCPNRYGKEKVSSAYGYPEGYRMKAVWEQVAILRRHFPALGTNEDDLEQLAKRPLPLRAEWAVIPRWEKVGATYCEAIQKIFALIASERKFSVTCKERLNDRTLMQSVKAMDAWKRLGEQQSGDWLIVATQFGLRFRGCSVRCATDTMYSYEFGLGTFAVACMLLTHPKREIKWEQLHPECGGDYFTPIKDEQLVRTPLFSFRSGELKLDSVQIDNPGDGFGCASGFLPQAEAL